MRRWDHPNRVAALLAMTAVLSLTVAGCGDDDVISAAGFAIQVNQAGIQQLPGGIVAVPFTITGNGNDAFSLLIQFAVNPPPNPPQASFITGSEIIPGVTPGSSPGGVPLVSNSSGNLSGGTFTGVFYWDAVTDLGPFGPVPVAIQLIEVGGGFSPSTGGNQTSGLDSGGASNIVIIVFTPSNPAVLPAPGEDAPGDTPGAAAGGSGRAGHTDFWPGSGHNVAIAGGRNNAAVNNAFTSIDRFDINLATLQYMSTSSTMLVGRTDHASSFFLDPVTGFLKLLVTGGAVHGATSTAPQNSANVYSFTSTAIPADTVTFTAGTMASARRGHTATWAPNGRVYLFGGESAPGVGATSIEFYDPTTDMFSTVVGVSSLARRDHTATLLPSGKILIAGGFDPAAPTTPLASELFDTVNHAFVAITGPSTTFDAFGHTATRLANGWVLLAGGRLVSNSASVLDVAKTFRPELGSVGEFTPTSTLMGSPRSLHAAVLLGDGNVLVTGGELASGVATPSAELFLPAIYAFSPVTSMLTGRAEHTSTTIDNGTVVVIAGRNGASFLNDIEFYPLNNSPPALSGASLVSSGTAGVGRINVTATDADGDGGYVIFRWRPSGGGPYSTGRLVPDPAAPTSPFGRVAPGANALFWEFSASIGGGQAVDMQLIPVGAVIGTPLNFSGTTP
jgi:hypothetical protein